MRRLAWLLALALAACAPGPTPTPAPTPAATASPTPTPVPTPSPTPRPVVTLEGPGIGFSDRFRLAGDYNLTWTAETDAPEPCFHGAFLKVESGPEVGVVLASEMVTRDGSGSRDIDDLPDQRYFLEVPSSCVWSFTFTPR